MKAVIFTINRKIQIIDLELIEGFYSLKSSEKYLLLNLVNGQYKYVPFECTPFEAYQQFETLSIDLIPDSLFREVGSILIEHSKIKELNIYSCCQFIERPYIIVSDQMFDGCDNLTRPLYVNCTFNTKVYYEGILMIGTIMYVDEALTIPFVQDLFEDRFILLSYQILVDGINLLYFDVDSSSALRVLACK